MMTLIVLSQGLCGLLGRDTTMHLILTSSQSILWCLVAARLAPREAKMHQPQPSWLSLRERQCPPTSLWFLSIVMSFLCSLQTHSRGPGGIADKYSVLLSVVCAVSLCHFPTVVGSTHQSALQLYHWEFFIRSKISLVIAACVRRDVFSPELLDMQGSHSFSSEKLTWIRWYNSRMFRTLIALVLSF